MEGRLAQILDEARDDQGILALLLFGSRSRDEAHARSDADICLVLTPGHDSPDERVRARLRYLPSDTLDVSVFQQLPLYIRRRVLREGRVLFCRDLDALYDLAYRTAKVFEDYRPRYRSYLELVSLARP